MHQHCPGRRMLPDEFKGLVQCPGINGHEVEQCEIEIDSMFPKGMGSISLGSQIQNSKGGVGNKLLRFALGVPPTEQEAGRYFT